MTKWMNDLGFMQMESFCVCFYLFYTFALSSHLQLNPLIPKPDAHTLCEQLVASLLLD